jgi:hypothetical protein
MNKTFNNNKKSGSTKDAGKTRKELPYGFVPVEKEKLSYHAAADLGKYDENLLSGYINCKLYVLNKLLVGNKQVSISAQNSKIWPIKIDDRILIPATTLKSCISNILAAHLQYPMTRISDKEYGFSGKADLSDKFEQDYCEYDKDKLKKNETNLIEELFGYSIDDKGLDHKYRAKSGKVHFSYAVAKDSYSSQLKEVTLPFAGSPYLGKYKFYDRKKFFPDSKNNGPKLRLAGRKFFVSTNENNICKADCRTLYDVLHADKSYPEFSFKVYYENLSSFELRLLCFALCLGQNIDPNSRSFGFKQDVAYFNDPNEELLCHQIGYGKNFGFGAIKICIDENDLHENQAKPYVIRIRNTKGVLEACYSYPKIIRVESQDLKAILRYYKKPREYPPKKS